MAPKKKTQTEDNMNENTETTETNETPAARAPAAPVPGPQVVMEDGTVQQFASKQKMVKEVSHNAETGEISIVTKFLSGKIHRYTMPATLMVTAAMFGLSERYSNAISGQAGDDVEKAILELQDNLDKGQWISRANKGEGSAATSILMEALMEAYQKPFETIKLFLSNKTHAQKMALRRSEKLAPIIERIEAERASKKTVDTATGDSLLFELEGMEG